MFPDSDDLDACPKLRSRPQGRLSALCVPVSIMGRTVGVIHATAEPQAAVEDDRVDDLATLAKLAGARIGLLHVMAETQLQASTDTLTGLLNRRAFSEQVGGVPPHLHPIAVAMADLDHFKALNDTYGHETGDRALRLFARVLRDSLRSSDIISRYGGEEFAIAFPDCSAIEATRALNTARAQLDAAITVGGLPSSPRASASPTPNRARSWSPSCAVPTMHCCWRSVRVATGWSCTTPAVRSTAPTKRPAPSRS